MPTLAALSYPASRFEREMQDLYGIRPDGHPQPRHLVRHRHWPQGWHPMRHDAGPPPPFGQTDEPFPFVNVEGAGVYEIPVGPVHAGLIEPGHFRFSVVGETIVRLKARLWYVHKGIEKLFEGRQPADGLALAERISGDTAVGHTLAYCRAVEDALGIDVPADGDPNPRPAPGPGTPLQPHQRHRRTLQRRRPLASSTPTPCASKNRSSASTTTPPATGCYAAESTSEAPPSASVPDAAHLHGIADDIRDVVDLALANSLVAERFTGTAILTRNKPTKSAPSATSPAPAASTPTPDRPTAAGN